MAITDIHDGASVSYTLAGTDISVAVSEGDQPEESDALEWRGAGNSPVRRIPGQPTNGISLTIALNDVTYPLLTAMHRTIPKPTETLTKTYPWGGTEDFEVQLMSMTPSAQSNEVMAAECEFTVTNTLTP